ncbi:hypothetical protein XF30_03350 [Bradyrhizobium sp. SUTN9-2]|uniref:hypothetical protein n=1 Tax=Bradyrhizobium sp. SUTN9-2 TaxID=1167456 RepID=UPI000D66C93B|nr:hypothetical protein [Bradyrhizobium sp. SUTN9-2]PWE75936.1 hypothetical protein XF30_03350 [Bradyrhizobium sp. SUTN9-2]
MQVLTEDQPLNELPGDFCTDGSKQGGLVSPEGSAQEVNNPASFAKRFVAHRAASVEEEVSCTVVLSEGMTAFATDETLMKEFLLELARAKVLTAAEVAEGVGAKTSNSTVSRLKKIKQNAKVILHPKILPYVQPGYSVLYQMALLYDAIEDIRGIEDADAAIAKLHEMLASSDGPATRDWLKKERDKLRPPTPAKTSTVQPVQTETADKRRAEPNDRSTVPASISRRDMVAQSETGDVVNEKETDQADSGAGSDEPTTIVTTTPKSQDVYQLSEKLIEVLSLADISGDEAVLLIRGSRGSLLSTRKTLQKKIEARNIHFIAKEGVNGWAIADEQSAA